MAMVYGYGGIDGGLSLSQLSLSQLEVFTSFLSVSFIAMVYGYSWIDGGQGDL
jgi:hypothetical protein